MMKYNITPAVAYRFLATILLALALMVPSAAQAAAAKPGPYAVKVASFLPEGKKLETATCEELSAAMAKASAADPEHAADMMVEVIRYLRAVQPETADSNTRRFPTDDCVRELMEAALAGAPGMSSQIVEAVLGPFPEYGPAINSVINPNGSAVLGPGGVLGPGFPGGPSGSPGRADDDDESPVTPDRP